MLLPHESQKCLEQPERIDAAGDLDKDAREGAGRGAARKFGSLGFVWGRSARIRFRLRPRLMLRLRLRLTQADRLSTDRPVVVVWSRRRVGLPDSGEQDLER